MDRIFQRQLAALDYVDPEDLLREIRPSVVGILQKPETVKHLSQAEKNVILEKHQAGYLALLSKRHSEGFGVDVKVAYGEIADCDCVIRAVDPVRGTVYKLTQLKQLPPEEVNPSATLQRLMDGFKAQYRDPNNLIVAVWINRNSKVSFEELDFTGVGVEQLWFFGDSVTGDLTLDGGQVADLLLGLRWSSRLNGLELQIQPMRFRPLQPA